MFQKEWQVVARLEGRGLTYTRLIDDITISSPKRLPERDITKIVKAVEVLLHQYEFRSNADKFRIYSRSNPEELMQITGLWVNRRHPRLRKKVREQIAKEVIDLANQPDLDAARTSITFREDYSKVSGKVALLSRLKHTEASRLRECLQTIPPLCDDAEKSKLEKLISRFGKKLAERSKYGYIKQFYRFQHALQYVANDSPILAKSLQRQLNKVRPTKTLREIDG